MRILDSGISYLRMGKENVPEASVFLQGEYYCGFAYFDHLDTQPRNGQILVGC